MNFEQQKDDSIIEIPHQEVFDQKIKALREAGPEKLHVLTDFDRTLTNGYIGKDRTPSIISQIRSGNYLSSEYAKQAHALFDHYHPLEIDTSIPLETRMKAMDEWWMKHFELLFASGLTLEVLQTVVNQRKRVFRPGALDFLDACQTAGIPVVIMSASLGDMIRLYLEQEGRMSDNIHIIANNFAFNKEGVVIDVHKPIVHSLNKTEVILEQIPEVHDVVEARKHVILMGDGLGDIGMIDGFDAETVLKIGFYNDADESRIEEYQQAFDFLVKKDAPMKEVNQLLTSLLD